jgi:hypothetical protein
MLPSGTSSSKSWQTVVDLHIPGLRRGATTSGSGEPPDGLKETRSWITDAPPPAPHQLSSTSMAIGTFNIPRSKPSSKVIKTLDAIDVAAKYFVYKLYEATGRQPMQWAPLHGLGESRPTISRAVERGWVILQAVGGKPLDRKAALTDEGRRLARKVRQTR